MKTVALPLFLGLTSLFLLHCAEGSTFEGGGEGGDDEEFTSSGNGSGSGSSGNTAGGAGGKPGSSSSGGAEGGEGGASASSSASSASSSSGAGSSSSSASSSASSSSSGGGPCDPENPGGVCGAAQHCLPKPDGIPLCQGPVGGEGQYGSCFEPSECLAAYECVDTGGFLPCCLKWCNANGDCDSGETCKKLSLPVYVGSTEYGVCSDSLGCF